MCWFVGFYVVKVTTNLSSNSLGAKVDLSIKQIDYGVRTRRSQLNLITSSIFCDEALIPARGAITIPKKLVRMF